MRSSKERVVRRRLADGTIREYRYVRSAPKKGRLDPESLGALIAAYRQSPEWNRKAPETKRVQGFYFRDLEELRGAKITDVRRKTILSVRNAIASVRGNGAARNFTRVASIVFAWGRENGWIEASPLDRVKGLPGGHLPAWTAQEADLAASRLPDPLARVVTLARFTGQRRGDLIALTWVAYDGVVIRLRQRKTAVSLVIPCHPTLKSALDRWKREARSMHILTGSSGRPWAANGLTRAMGLALPKIGLRPGLGVHGLRKLAAAELASAGCTVHEIAAITGHRTLAMVQAYTTTADQERLATAAIIRLQERLPKQSGK